MRGIVSWAGDPVYELLRARMPSPRKAAPRRHPVRGDAALDMLYELRQGDLKSVRFTGPRVRHALANKAGQVRIPLQDKVFRQNPIPFDAQERAQWESSIRPLCPYGEPGTLLWVRETWVDLLAGTSSARVGNEGVVYRADAPVNLSAPSPTIWQPSSRMPRWAARVLIRVTDVRVEQLQDISDSDALDEGVVTLSRTSEAPAGYGALGESSWYGTARNAFAAIAGEEDWRSNSWCWVLDYRVELIHQSKLS